MNAIQKPLQQLFSAVRGNARVIVITEGISTIAFQWYFTYLSLYMAALGLDEVAIGWLASAYLATQLISTLLGGYFADRYGRKRVAVVGDILFWGIPLFLFGIARNPWYLLAGRLLNGFISMVGPSFECLLVEDVPEENRQAVFGLLTFLNAAGGLLAPIAGIMVAEWGMITAGQVMMFATCAMAVGIAIVRQFTLVESCAGQARVIITQQFNLPALLKEFQQAIGSIAGDPGVRSFLVIRVVTTFSAVVSGTYAMIFLTAPGGGALPKSFIAVLPTVSALVTLAAIGLSAERFSMQHVYGNLVAGQVLMLVSIVVFVLAPAQPYVISLVWMLISTLSAVLFQPASLSYWANIVDDRQRALVYSASSAIILLSCLPAGPLAGFLYELSPRLPFIGTFVLQALGLGLILRLGRGRKEPILGE